MRMNNLADYLEGVRTVAIAGHVNPDGDCIGSCMGVWLYLCDNFPDLEADVYMQPPREVFGYIRGFFWISAAATGSAWRAPMWKRRRKPCVSTTM